MLADKTVKEFLQETASSAPVPGGGSVAALSAGLAAALTAMVANLTIGKKGYEGLEEEMERIAKEAEQYRDKFIEYIDKDSESFNQVMAAFKLPKETEEEKEIRKEMIQRSYKTAALVPLEVARNGLKIMDIIEIVVVKGNKNAVTDGAVAAMMARTATLSALYNVKINLGSIKDTEFVEKVSKEVVEIEEKVVKVEKEILGKVAL
ncbi:cyclodeaminase/cyclohydrolase family protein [Lutispora thermophila]|uniref:Formiminotetrahydrofolate cyclodeaminase n=1 Tax=Lutispora thermophila DSM 19022 TaxID=1122184 RepID=A0A1M6CEC3_9FIRM|nr:cyclodeaminase/cyclohydrolase family protein [Lutispora thermophila]SHI59114.1 formiminotetrahydrofolate cyclodeaminase [Lutispora thermophila DSM 19022]